MSFFLVPICPHLPKRPSVQSAHFPKCLFVPVHPCPQCPKYRFAPKCSFVPVFTCFQCHLSQIGQPFDQNTHLLKLLICPNCSFALVLIFPGGHFPPMFISPKCSFASIVDLLWCSFFLVPISPNCPFSPNAHLPQCSSFPKCPFGSKCSFAANSLPVCPRVHEDLTRERFHARTV